MDQQTANNYDALIAAGTRSWVEVLRLAEEQDAPDLAAYARPRAAREAEATAPPREQRTERSPSSEERGGR